MIQRIATCNRCGKTIEEPHPDRISIYRHSVRHYTDHFKKPHKRSVYKADKPIHLCATCRRLLDDFLNECKFDYVPKAVEDAVNNIKERTEQHESDNSQA